MIIFTFLSGIHTDGWLATLILFLLFFIVFIIELFAVHFFIWCFWYPYQMRQWKKDYANAFDDEERKRLLYVRRRMRLFWIPFYFLKKF